MSELRLKVPTDLGVERVCRLLCAVRGEDADAVVGDVAAWRVHVARVREVLEIMCAVDGLNSTVEVPASVPGEVK